MSQCTLFNNEHEKYINKFLESQGFSDQNYSFSCPLINASFGNLVYRNKMVKIYEVYALGIKCLVIKNTYKFNRDNRDLEIIADIKINDRKSAKLVKDYFKDVNNFTINKIYHFNYDFSSDKIKSINAETDNILFDSHFSKIKKLLDNHLNNDNILGPAILVYGETGSGKTSFAKKYCHLSKI